MAWWPQHIFISYAAAISARGVLSLHDRVLAYLNAWRALCSSSPNIERFARNCCRKTWNTAAVSRASFSSALRTTPEPREVPLVVGRLAAGIIGAAAVSLLWPAHGGGVWPILHVEIGQQSKQARRR
eukprot:COSAG01_NODE_9153_length_2534_cov_21.192556_1_plen_126_part_10